MKRYLLKNSMYEKYLIHSLRLKYRKSICMCLLQAKSTQHLKSGKKFRHKVRFQSKSMFILINPLSVNL